MQSSTVTRRTWGKAVAGSAAVAAAVGCGRQAAQEPGLSRASRAAKVTWMATGGQSRIDVHQKQIARFKELTGHDVEFIHHTTGNYEEKLFSMYAAGTAPDIFRLEGPSIPGMVAKSQIMELDGLIARDKLDLGDFFPTGLQMYEWQRKQYALPWLAYRVLFYNVDLLERNGVARPPTDWKDKKWSQQTFLAALKRFVPAGAAPQPGGTWAFGSPFTPQDAWVWSLGNGGEVLDGDDRRFMLDQPAAVEGLQFFADLIGAHFAHPTVAQASQDATQNAFLSGRMAFYYGAVATAGRLKEVSFRSDTAPMPWGTKATATTGGGHAWPLNKSSKEQEATWQLQRFLASKENDLLQVQSGEAPPFRKSTATLEAWKERRPPEHPVVMAEGAAYLARRPKAPTWGDAERVLNTALQPVWNGQRTARAALQAVKPEVQSILDQGWQQVGRA
jgi:multiple sugar transport system substrate-binding protein